MHACGVLLGQIDQFGSLGVVVRRDVGSGEVAVVVDVVDAVDDTLAASGAARVPADHVEIVGDLRSEPAGGIERQRRAISTGAATIGEHRTGRWVGGRSMTGDVQVDGVALWVVVVERHGQRALVGSFGDRCPLDGVVERFRRGGLVRSGVDGGVGDTGDVTRCNGRVVRTAGAGSQRDRCDRGHRSEGRAAHRLQRMGDRVSPAGRRTDEIRNSGS